MPPADVFMELLLLRYSSQKDDSLGLLFLNGLFQCFTLEDESRAEKVAGETRIPAGTYSIELRQEGTLTKKYAERFPDLHKGMLWLQDVPGFEWIYIHCGNDDDDTDGCILVGDEAHQNVTANGFLGASAPAYRRVYPLIAEAILQGQEVTIKVVDIQI